MVPFRNLPGRSHRALNATLEEKIATSVDFKYWTGVDADVTVMRKALEKALSL